MLSIHDGKVGMQGNYNFIMMNNYLPVTFNKSDITLGKNGIGISGKLFFFINNIILIN